MWQPGPAYLPSGSKERNVRLTGSGKVYKAVSFIVAVIIKTGTAKVSVAPSSAGSNPPFPFLVTVSSGE